MIMSADEIVSELREILENVSEISGIQNYEIEFNENALRGDGFLAEFYTGSVKNKDTNENFNVAIKKAYKSDKMRELLNVRNAFVAENNFYSRLFPELDKFQKEAGVSAPFNSIPRFFFGIMEPYKEAVVMENIKSLGYTMHDKHLPLKEDHIKYVFQEYGRFHAISFAYKDQRFEEYQKLTENLYNYYEQLANSTGFVETIQSICKDVNERLDEKMSEAFKPYVKDCAAEFRKCLRYKGHYSGILHGDCWSNNMMFKYDKSGKIESMRILDFQLTGVGTPVNDLSYFFYAGVYKEEYDRLDEYLEIYHRSFCDFAKELGSDPIALYPLKAFKEDWINNSKFGMIMSFLLFKIKLMDKKQIANFTQGSDDKLSQDIDQQLFMKRCTDLVEHACERKLL